MTWHTKFLGLADHIATWSKDSTQVGCVLIGDHKQVIAQGYNGIPRYARDDLPERQVRPEKYWHVVHAELNAICNAALTGTPTSGSSAYVSLHPCMECAKALVQAGVEAVYTRKPDFDMPKWGEHFKRAQELFLETKTQIVYLP